MLPPDQVIEKLKKCSGYRGANQYQPYQGLYAFREAIAEFSKSQLKVVLNPEDEILPLMGSKEGIAHISLAYLNKEIRF